MLSNDIIRIKAVNECMFYSTAKKEIIRKRVVKQENTRKQRLLMV